MQFVGWQLEQVLSAFTEHTSYNGVKWRFPLSGCTDLSLCIRSEVSRISLITDQVLQAAASPAASNAYFEANKRWYAGTPNNPVVRR